MPSPESIEISTFVTTCSKGPHAWPTVDSSTWNDEGITISGEGHTVCFNTLSGFGDALGLANSTAIPNIAIDFYGNDVLWTGDDMLELDFAHRNVRAFENRGTNIAMGASLQPAWGGPVYIFKNVFLNRGEKRLQTQQRSERLFHLSQYVGTHTRHRKLGRVCLDITRIHAERW